MIARIQGRRAGAREVLDYVTHDSGSRETFDRVEWMECLNMPQCGDSKTAALIMQRLIADAETLKRMSGVSTRGRKLEFPIEHITISWAPGERPGPITKRAAAEEVLRVLGYDECQTVIVSHADKHFDHLHLVVNRVHPETGRACGRQGNSGLLLSDLAGRYELEHGIVVPNRFERLLARLHDEPLPPMERKAVRDRDGKPRQHSDEEREAWNSFFTERRLSDASPAEELESRLKLAWTLEVMREVAEEAAKVERLAGPVRPVLAESVPPVITPTKPALSIPPPLEIVRGPVPEIAAPVAPVWVPEMPRRPPPRGTPRGPLPALQPETGPAMVPAFPRSRPPEEERGPVPALAPEVPPAVLPPKPDRRTRDRKERVAVPSSPEPTPRESPPTEPPADSPTRGGAVPATDLHRALAGRTGKRTRGG